MKITHELVNELHCALAQVASRHELIVLIHPVVADDWLQSEFEFSFRLCEMSDKELEDSKCG